MLFRSICTGSGVEKATWSNLGSATNTITVFSGSQPLTGSAVVCETKDTDVLVIPQVPTAVGAVPEVATLTVKYTYDTPAGSAIPEQVVTLPLTVTGGWKSGYKYTYTLHFKSSEILIAPKYDEWANGGNQTVVVE